MLMDMQNNQKLYDTTERTKYVLANISHTSMNLAQNIDSSKETFTITRSKRKS